jgi:hypothetical protein
MIMSGHSLAACWNMVSESDPQLSISQLLVNEQGWLLQIPGFLPACLSCKCLGKRAFTRWERAFWNPYTYARTYLKKEGPDTFDGRVLLQIL